MQISRGMQAVSPHITRGRAHSLQCSDQWGWPILRDEIPALHGMRGMKQGRDPALVTHCGMSAIKAVGVTRLPVTGQLW